MNKKTTKKDTSSAHQHRGEHSQMKKLTKKDISMAIESKLSHVFSVNPKNASDVQLYKACSLVARDLLIDERAKFVKNSSKDQNAKKVYYLCMEFLMGRSLKNALFNLGLTTEFEGALKEYGVTLDTIFEQEPDAGLGNGGLGRLAACYLDGLANQGFDAMGYSIRYEYGIFRQKIIEGWQTELPDFWLPGGEVWLVARREEAKEIHIGGLVGSVWHGDFHQSVQQNYSTIYAIPYDMMVPSADGKDVAILRLWASEAPGFDMSAFNEGNYMSAVEENAMAQVISKVLYPADNHVEGKSLRLKQQYFLVSASVQDIIHRHLSEFGTLDNLPEKVAIHINDTHPTMAIPEMMRIMLDECGYGWEQSMDIVRKTFAYTNHTVMAEALECWPEDLYKTLFPRIYEITKEMDNRLRSWVWENTHNAETVEKLAIISAGTVKMANLCVSTCHSVNGVSALHSQILKDSVFNDYYNLMPYKFKNVTNGIAHRRWLCQANPALTKYLEKKIGKGFIKDGAELAKLKKFADDDKTLDDLMKIKKENKVRFANYIKKKQGVEINPDSIFDVQVKRLHEYKRQLLNALNIWSRYLQLKRNPDMDFVPHTYIFGAKAAPGYHVAKKIIEFICTIAEVINNDETIGDKMKVVYVEDYNVSVAEMLMPAADISEQISLAGTEASGTGNMKLMINGAVTLGTMDGANVEIFENVGEDNIIIFGMDAAEVDALKNQNYRPQNYYINNPNAKEVIDSIMAGIGGKEFPEIINTLTTTDQYMVLADFNDYQLAQQKVDEIWKDGKKFARMSLMNIASAGIFAADRAILEYADDIWNATPVKL